MGDCRLTSIPTETETADAWHGSAYLEVSLHAKIAAALMAVLFFAGVEWKIYQAGKASGMEQVQQRRDAQGYVAERQVAEQAAAQQQVITKTVTQFVERAAQERIVYRGIIKEVEKYVPNTLPMLPSDFRVLHDAAAAGVAPPEAGDPARVDAAPVAPVTVAATVADNYAACRYDQGRLEALQTIIKAGSSDAQF